MQTLNRHVSWALGSPHSMGRWVARGEIRHVSLKCRDLGRVLLAESKGATKSSDS